MIYALLGTWLLGAYAFGWYRGRQGWPFLWRVARETPPAIARSESKSVTLPVDEPDRMRERLQGMVPGFVAMTPEAQEKILERLKHRAEEQLGLRS